MTAPIRSNHLVPPREKEKTSVFDPLNSLYIEHASPKDGLKIIGTAAKWNVIALKKIIQTALNREGYAFAQLLDNQLISAEIGLEAICYLPLGAIGGRHLFPFYLCKDNIGKIRGMAVAWETEDAIEGHLLVTDPRNIRCRANRSESDRVKGVGRAFIQEAIKRKKSKIVFTSLESAKPFYAKVGLHPINSVATVKTVSATALPSKL